MVMSRLSLPQDFEDRISKRMLTVAVPAFFWSQLLDTASTQFNLASIQASSMGLTPERSPSSEGADPGELVRLQAMLEDPSGQSSVFMVSDELSASGQGHTIRFDRPVFAGGGYTVAARRQSANTTISTTPIDFSAEQVFLTLERLAGPYGSTGTQVQPYAIDRKDSKRAVHSLAKLAAQNLKFDRIKLVDSVINALVDSGTAAQVNGAANYLVPGRGRKTVDTNMVTNGDTEFDLETLLRMEQTMVDRNVQRLPNGKYMLVIKPVQAKQLVNDSDFRSLVPFEPTKNPLNNAYVGETSGVMIYRSTTLTVDTTTVAGVNINHGVMLGAEAFGYGLGDDVEVVTSAVDNYGNQALFIWQSTEAFGLLNTQYMLGVHSN